MAEAETSNRAVREKPSVRMLLRVSLCLAITSGAIAMVSNLGLYINGDFLPEEVRGPHSLAGAVGEMALQVGIFVIPCAMILSFFGLLLSFFRAPVVANFLVALGGLLLAAVAWRINTHGLMRVRANPARRHAAEVTKLGTLIDRYVKEHGGYLPIPDKWCERLIEFDPNAAHYLSYPMPKDTPPGFSTLALNARLADKRLAEVPNGVVLLFGTQPAQNPVGDHRLLSTDECLGKGTVVLFADSHVEFVKAGEFGRLQWDTLSGGAKTTTVGPDLPP